MIGLVYVSAFVFLTAAALELGCEWYARIILVTFFLLYTKGVTRIIALKMDSDNGNTNDNGGKTSNGNNGNNNAIM